MTAKLPRSKSILRPIVSLILISNLSLIMAPGPAAASVLQSSSQTMMSWQQQLSGYLDWLTKRNVPSQAKRTGVKPAPPETKAEKEARVASIAVSPRNEVTMMSRESKIFTGIPLNSQGGTVQGLLCEWRSTNNQVIFIRKNGMAVAGNPGTAELIVQAGNKSQRVRVTVVNNPSNEKYPGKKRTDSTRTVSGAIGKHGSGSASVSNIKSERKRAHASRPFSPAPMRNPNDDPLPDTESSSLYDQGNLVGSPSGKKKAGARIASVASGSIENGNKNFSFLIQESGDPVGGAAYHGNRIKDWGQALFGSSQYASERAGNIAGRALGDALWNYLRGNGSQSELTDKMRGILCQ